MSATGTLSLDSYEVEHGKVRCQVIDFNRFGNVQLNVREAHLAAASMEAAGVVAVEALSGSADARRGATYADFASGEYGVIFDPRGWLTIVRGNPASALEGLGLSLGDPVWISPARAAADGA